MSAVVSTTDVFIHTERSCRCWCCSVRCYTTAIVAAAAVAVRHRVPDGKNCCWFNESDQAAFAP